MPQRGTWTEAVPFNRPSITVAESDAVAEVLAHGYMAGDGPFTARAREALEGLHPGASVLLTTSGTAALEMAALLLNPSRGDEVIVPSFTFSSTAAAFALAGATLVFADVDPLTWCLSPESVAACIGPRTKAIVTVHYGGVPGNLQALAALAAAAGVTFIEDAAHGLFGSSAGTPLGTFGRTGILSFHETKNLTSGEGGALLVNDPDDLARAEIIREKGTNRTAFFRGDVDKYTWVDIGSSYVMSDLNAALLGAQLGRSDAIQATRRAAVEAYSHNLDTWATKHGFVFQHVPADADVPAHLFAMLAPTPESRTRFIAHMRAHGVAAVFHYQPLHCSPAGLRFGRTGASCDVSIDVADRLVRLPVYSDIRPDEVDRVIAAVLQWP